MKRNPTILILAAAVIMVPLTGCKAAEAPFPSPTRAAALPTASSTPQPTATAEPERTSTPVPASPTSTPALKTLLENLPPLEPANLDRLTSLGMQSLDPRGQSLEFTRFDWSLNGRWIVTCSLVDGTTSSYRVYDVNLGTSVSETAINSSACKESLWDTRWLEFSRDGSLFLGMTASPHFFDEDHPQGPAIFDSQTGESLAALEVPPADFPGEIGVLERAAFSSQGTRLALAVNYPSRPASTQDASVEGGAWINYRTGIQLYDVETGAHWGTFQKPELWEILDLSYSTAGDYLLTASFESVQAWHLDGTLVNQADCPVAGISFSPTAEIAALACRPDQGGPYQLLWDPVTGEENLLTGAPGNDYLELSFSPDGRMLIGLSKNGLVSIWHGVSGEHLFSLPETFDQALEAHFTHGGRVVAVLSRDGQIRLHGVQ